MLNLSGEIQTKREIDFLPFLEDLYFISLKYHLNTQ